MNSMPADVDVNAQWHHRDMLGAIRRIVIINNSAYSSAVQGGCRVYVCLSDMLQYVLIYMVFVRYRSMKECGYVFLLN